MPVLGQEGVWILFAKDYSGAGGDPFWSRPKEKSMALEGGSRFVSLSERVGGEKKRPTGEERSPFTDRSSTKGLI